MICYHPPSIDSVPIAEAVNRLSRVDAHGSAVQAARALGISFGDRPADESPFALPSAVEQTLSMTQDLLETAASACI
jgi:hypothetical protein